MESYIRRPELEMLKIVRKYFLKQNYDCKMHQIFNADNRAFEFDLICRKTENNSISVIIVEVKTSGRIFDSDIRSFVTKKSVVERKSAKEKYYFYLCINETALLSTTAKNFLNNYEIGVIRVGKTSVTSIETPESVDLKIDRVLSNSFRKIAREKALETQEKLENQFLMLLREEVDSQIKEIRDTVAPVRTVPYKLRISGELISKLKDLSHLGYSDLLKKFSEQYELIDNANDENRLVLKTLGNLWEGKYGKTQGARAFASFEKFEPILKDTPRYRDHMIHPFQVFLMGSLIIDANYDFFVSTHNKRFIGSKEDSLEFAWLLCSTFHDICYPIQKYEEFSQNFFREFLQSQILPITFQPEKILLENGNLKYVDQLVSLYSHYQKQEESWKFDSPCTIDQDLRSEMIAEFSNKNHALLSAVALIKKIITEEHVQKNLVEYLEGTFSTVIYPAAIAIALHDDKMLNRIKTEISIDVMPLCFLLIYCDLVQEFGRSDGEEIVELHSFNCEAANIESTLSFTKEDSFKYKTEEMEKIYKKIHCPSIHYKLNLRFSGSTRSEDTFMAPT